MMFQKTKQKVIASNKVWLLASGFWLLVISGCVTTSDFDALKNNITNLQVESINQKKEIAQIKTNLSEISKDVTSVKEYSIRKEHSISAMKESQSAILTQTTDLSRELQTLKGRFDENKYFMDKTIKELLSERELQQAKIASLENEIKELKLKASNISPEKKETAVTTDKTAETAAGTSTGSDIEDPLRLYDDAQIELKEKRYAEARQKFEKLAKDFPNHILVPNAYFWIGEAYYADKKYEDAILSYETLLKKHPKHEKARGAMLKQAYAFIELGDKKTGKVILEKVMEKYPKSREADLAEKKIAEMLSKTKSKTEKKR
jgi:tol-pal system protein YbgF